jgi:hypothetical protein
VLDREAIKRGFTDWIDAYHRYIPPSVATYSCPFCGGDHWPSQH